MLSLQSAEKDCIQSFENADLEFLVFTRPTSRQPWPAVRKIETQRKKTLRPWSKSVPVSGSYGEATKHSREAPFQSPAGPFRI